MLNPKIVKKNIASVSEVQTKPILFIGGPIFLAKIFVSILLAQATRHTGYVSDHSWLAAG